LTDAWEAFLDDFAHTIRFLQYREFLLMRLPTAAEPMATPLWRFTRRPTLDGSCWLPAQEALAVPETKSMSQETRMRVNVVTGSASGIGQATKELLESRGERVIGVDLHDADILANLENVEGREHMAAEVARLSDGVVDAVFAIAGLGGQTATCASVNYFGMISTLTMLRPLLERSAAPRAVLAASVMSLYPFDERLRASFEAWDEPAARARAEELGVEDAEGFTVYNTTKSSVALWVRRNAISEEWSGRGITLNGVAPGMIHTPLTKDFDNEEGHKIIGTFLAMPLNGWADPEEVADLMTFLNDVKNRHITGQVVFIDGGTDITMRADSTW
jgi:NAD(P)-dependent dehydrogenase (short-subunit alcohol dehydrogenase family)